MGYALSQVEVTGTIEVTGSSQFDLPFYPGAHKIVVERVDFTGQHGKVVEVTARGRAYKADGKIGRATRSSSIAPPGDFDPEQHDVSWESVPVRLQQEIIGAIGGLPA
jgi:hypothetical protein